MSTSIAEKAFPKISWSVEGFGRFWAKPTDVSRVAAVVTEDVVGHWPGREPVKGVAEYVKALADLIALLPDLRLEVAEHATNGEFVFIRWIMRATGTHGPFEIVGIDRVRLRDGLVAENIIRFETAEFRERSGFAAPGL